MESGKWKGGDAEGDADAGADADADAACRRKFGGEQNGARDRDIPQKISRDRPEIRHLEAGLPLIATRAEAR